MRDIYFHHSPMVNNKASTYAVSGAIWGLFIFTLHECKGHESINDLPMKSV